MKLLNQILSKSKEVDKKFESLENSKIDSIKIEFKVPSFHPRYQVIKKYSFSKLNIEKLIGLPIYKSTKNHIFLVGGTVGRQEFMTRFFKKNNIKPFILEAVEDKVKIKKFLDKFIEEKQLEKLKENCLLIVVGGGLLLNIGAYIAERLSLKLILFPTTVLSMADGAGGKVRVNVIAFNKAYKHYYKSFYEPDGMFFDERFLDSLPEKQIRIGLVEIIKHGLFQSPSLYNFLIRSGKDLFKNKLKLKKAIFWAADLKRVCLDIDVEEKEDGSRKILRAGHDFSDRLEEQLKFKIPHGFAVAIGIIKLLKFENNISLFKKAEKIFDLFEIPKTIEEFNSLKN